MIHIEKKQSPQWFETLKRTNRNWKYRDLPTEEKLHLRRELIEEQYYLCGYCCCAIKLEKAHNEHLKPQWKYTNNTLDYENIIVSCMGFKGKSCGTKKDNNMETLVFPTDPDCEEQFDYNADGTIVGKTTKAQRTIEVLGLNKYEMKKARQATLNVGFYYSRELAEECFRIPDDGKLLPFCNIVRWYIKNWSESWDSICKMMPRQYLYGGEK